MEAATRGHATAQKRSNAEGLGLEDISSGLLIEMVILFQEFWAGYEQEEERVGDDCSQEWCLKLAPRLLVQYK